MVDDKQVKNSRAEWSEDGQVFFCDGHAWGLEDNLNTICLGKSDEVKAILKGEKPIPDNMHTRRKAVLEQILRESGNGTESTEIGRRSLQRGGHAGTSRHREKHIRHSAKRKGLTLQKA